MASLPAPFSTIPRTPLTYPFPTPIEPLSRLTTHLRTTAPSAPTLWIKRDDTNSGLAGGGNKLRKLEYVLAAALAAPAPPTVVTTAGVQSNHMRQTAAACARLGLRCVLVPQDMVAVEAGTDDAYGRLGNVQLTELMRTERARVGRDVREVLAEVKARGETPFFIPPGASTHELGGLGYARAAFEVLAQEEQMGVFFDAVVVAAASGSTLAGLAAGFKLAEKHGGAGAGKRKIYGVDALAKPANEAAAELLQIARTTGAKIGLTDGDITEEDIAVDRRFNAGAYGKVDAATQETLKTMASLEGIILDPVYTGKAVTGLLHMVREGELGAARNVLYIHTGGQSALSGYPLVR